MRLFGKVLLSIYETFIFEEMSFHSLGLYPFFLLCSCRRFISSKINVADILKSCHGHTSAVTKIKGIVFVAICTHHTLRTPPIWYEHTCNKEHLNRSQKNPLLYCLCMHASISEYLIKNISVIGCLDTTKLLPLGFCCLTVQLIDLLTDKMSNQ